MRPKEKADAVVVGKIGVGLNEGRTASVMGKG